MKVKLTDVMTKLMAIHNVAVAEYLPPYKIEDVDNGIRKKLYRDFQWQTITSQLDGMLQQNVLYIICDIFGVYYAVFLAPEYKRQTIVIGPYCLTGNVFDEKVYENKGFGKAEIDEIRKYILSLPHIHEDIIMQQAVAVFSAASGEKAVEIKRIKENVAISSLYNQFSVVLDMGHSAFSPDKVEKRYKTENDILDAVAQGNITKAKSIMRNFPVDDIGQRYTSIRLIKNSLITMNTLLRKAVERANVHPYYIDEISYRFFQKIDLVSDRVSSTKLLEEMLVAYCDYAKRYSVQKYSFVVQKALNYIQTNITTKISLDDVAKECKVTPSHLARKFRDETGRSVVDSINHIRITQTANMLKETTLTVSEIAARVGINDTNYFSRLFRKYMGVSPTEYRSK